MRSPSITIHLKNHKLHDFQVKVWVIVRYDLLRFLIHMKGNDIGSFDVKTP